MSVLPITEISHFNKPWKHINPHYLSVFSESLLILYNFINIDRKFTIMYGISLHTSRKA